MDPRAAELAAARRDIAAALRETLGSFGVAGTVDVVGDDVQLIAGGTAPVMIELGPLVEQWPLLPAEMRHRRVGEVARRLVSAQRTVSRAPDAGRAAEPSPSRGLFFAIAAGVLVLLVGGVWLARSLMAGADAGRAGAASAAPVESDAEARARRARVCDAARKRVYSGASIGPFDVEGWYVELLLVGSGADDPGKNPRLAALVADKRLATAADAELAAVTNAAVEIVPPPERFARSPGSAASVLRFSGGYVAAYLEPAQRARFLAMADRMADESGAVLGALYGRCAHLAFHDLGAWFRGPDASGAATALVYAMGVFAESPAIDMSLLATHGTSELDALRKSAAKIDDGTLSALIGNQGGGVTRPASGAVTVTFPLGGHTRATSASRYVAKKMGVGLD